MRPLAPADTGSPAGCLTTFGIFMLLVSPVYLLMRYFVKIVRQTYGFEPVPEDAGPALRICDQCHSTVLEPEYEHCPYCGYPLPALPIAIPPAISDPPGSRDSSPDSRPVRDHE